MRMVVVAMVIAGATTAHAAPGIELKSWSSGAQLVSNLEANHTRIIGVDAHGKLLDYGDVDRKVSVKGGRVVGLGAGKVANAEELRLMTATFTYVLIVDANRPAKDAQAVVASL